MKTYAIAFALGATYLYLFREICREYTSLTHTDRTAGTADEEDGKD